MAKLISPQGSQVEVSEGQSDSLLRLGWKKPQSKRESEPEQAKPVAKRARSSKSE